MNWGSVYYMVLLRFLAYLNTSLCQTFSLIILIILSIRIPSDDNCSPYSLSKYPFPKLKLHNHLQQQIGPTFPWITLIIVAIVAMMIVVNRQSWSSKWWSWWPWPWPWLWWCQARPSPAAADDQRGSTIPWRGRKPAHPTSIQVISISVTVIIITIIINVIINIIIIIIGNKIFKIATQNCAK